MEHPKSDCLSFNSLYLLTMLTFKHFQDEQSLSHPNPHCFSSIKLLNLQILIPPITMDDQQRLLFSISDSYFAYALSLVKLLLWL